MDTSYDFLSIFIRSNGQRTVDQAKAAAQRNGVSDSSIFVINDESLEKPSLEFLSKCTSHSKPWTLILEGDVLLISDGIKKIGEFVNSGDFDSKNAHTFRLFDKFLGVPAYSGNIFMKTTHINPEVLLKVIEEGKLIPRKPLIGMKCVEQYFWDIYRDCYRKGVEHLNICGELINYYRKYYFVDNDFKIALKGILDGIYSGTDAPNKLRFLSFMDDSRLHEKKSFAPHATLDAQSLLNGLPTNNFLITYLEKLKKHEELKNGRP